MQLNRLAQHELAPQLTIRQQDQVLAELLQGTRTCWPQQAMPRIMEHTSGRTNAAYECTGCWRCHRPDSIFTPHQALCCYSHQLPLMWPEIS